MKKVFNVVSSYILPITIIILSSIVFIKSDVKTGITLQHFLLSISFGLLLIVFSIREKRLKNASKTSYQIDGNINISEEKDNVKLSQTLPLESNDKVKVKIKKLTPEAVIPSYAKNGDAGLDLIAISESFNNEFMYKEFGTGLSIEIPEGYVGLIFPRSSISDRSFALSNAVGVIDSGYRGEIKLRFKADGNVSTLFINKTGNPFLEAESKYYKLNPYKIGEKVAQLVILPYPQIQFEEVVELSQTERGNGGYGHTGK